MFLLVISTMAVLCLGMTLGLFLMSAPVVLSTSECSEWSVTGSVLACVKNTSWLPASRGIL